MIERQIGGGEHIVAVLAGVIVTGVDVRARERNVIEPASDLDEPEEPNDRRKPEGHGYRSYLAVVFRDHLDLPLAEERNRLPPMNHLERFV